VVGVKSYENIVVELDGPVATLALHRPKALNALSLDLKREVREAVGELERDESVRCLILTGKGKAFSAGQDLNERRDPGSPDDAGKRVRESSQFPEVFLTSRLPSISMIHGYCLGGALQMTLYTDVRVAAEDAKFGLPEFERGMACIAGMYLIGGVIGLGRAMPMLLRGSDWISANEAKDIGLVHYVVPRAELDATTGEMARKIASLPPAGVRATREWKARLFRRMNGVALEEMWDAVAHYHEQVYGTGQSQENVGRFLER
jgi:enoyl-CoA hydratase/carnithine racemase